MEEVGLVMGVCAVCFAGLDWVGGEWCLGDVTVVEKGL